MTLPSLFSGGPNPGAFPIENGLYGAKWAYPNTRSQKVLQKELDWAREHAVPKIDVTEGGSTAIQTLAALVAGQDCLYVVLLDGRVILIPAELEGEPTCHTMASDGAPVIAAGHVQVSDDGHILRWSHMSGHYLPDERQAMEVAHAVFTLAGLRP